MFQVQLDEPYPMLQPDFFISQTDVHRKLLKTRSFTIEIQVKVPAIRLGTCYKCSIHVPSRTRWALSNGAIRFFISQTTSIKNAKNSFFTIEIQVKVPAIRLRTCYKCSIHVPSTTRWALSNGTIRFFISQTMSIESC